MNGTAETPSAGTFAGLTAGVMAFTIYGSLVPFHFHNRPLGEAFNAFLWTMEPAHRGLSRSDFVANTILGIPLGFCLLAALRLDKPLNIVKGLLVAVVAWPWCVLFSTLVEFSQLFFEGRTCTWSDILAQGLGAAIGMLAWLGFGERLVRRFRKIWQGNKIGGTAGRLTVIYICILAVVQWLPLDLTLSPAEVYHKNLDLDSKTRLNLMPFSESAEAKLPAWLELTGIYFSLGLLAAGISRPPWNTIRGFGQVLARAALVALIVEAGQLFVLSRTASLTDVVIGTLAATAAWLLVRLIRTVPGRGLSRDYGLILIQIWIALLLIMNWSPFDFDRSIIASKFDQLNWIPFAAAYEKNYLSSLEEAAAKILLIAPLGAIVAAVGVRRVVNWQRGMILGIVAAALIEVGQLALPSRVASPTDLFFGAAGGWLGAAVALRLRAFGYGFVPPKADPVRFKVK